MKYIIMKKCVIFLLVFVCYVVILHLTNKSYQKDAYTMCENNLYQLSTAYNGDVIDNEKNDTEYFRPSKLPILNNKEFKTNFFASYVKESNNDTLPKYLFEKPEDTLINFFSILRQAANSVKGKITGCGTLGYSKVPYPVAYRFLSSEYQKSLSYEQFLALFQNILHLNLIKLQEVPRDNLYPNELKYFIEFETIEGSETGVGYFAYYYGYIRIKNIDDTYKISHIEFHGEDYLCAPYHGWNYIGEFVVDIKYGNWCSLVAERYETQQNGYIKNICFKGTDNFLYRIEFFQLTNGKDIEIAQYRKSDDGEWKLIKLDPERCLDDNES